MLDKMAFDWIANRCFHAVHQKNLVYNTCWEDPKVDRQALKLTDRDTVAVITSGGCNTLDYVLEGPREVHAIDVNVLQNALLELKMVAVDQLHYDDFFQAFGQGHHQSWQSIYFDALRPNLSPASREIWDLRCNFFDGSHQRRSFYFRGTSGLFAWLMTRYVRRSRPLAKAVEELLEAPNVETQREIYARHNVDQLLWTKSLRWFLRRDTTMAMLGVPRSQRMQIDKAYPNGIAGFIQDRISSVFKHTPLAENYFWRVYLTGEYTRDCCPEYLREENFRKLKSGLTRRVHIHTQTVEGFLRDCDSTRISRFVLLDHMDWLYSQFPDRLASEWQAIIDRATPDARVLWRSAALKVDFVDPLKVRWGGTSHRLGDLLRYQTQLADSLHTQDRVHTYGSFYIADLDGVAA